MKPLFLFTCPKCSTAKTSTFLSLSYKSFLSGLLLNDIFFSLLDFLSILSSPPSPFLPFPPPPLTFFYMMLANMLDGLQLWGIVLKLITHTVGLFCFSKKQIRCFFSQVRLLSPSTFYISQPWRHAVETV